MEIIGTFLGVVLLGMIVLALGGGLLVLLAYGVGWLVNLLMGLEPFQATALTLAGIFVFIILVDRFINSRSPTSSYDLEDDEYDDEDDDEYDDEIDDYEIIEEEVLDKIYAGVPRWRRPSKNLDFSKAKPDDRCPCGSGRKYKNCHGATKKKI